MKFDKFDITKLICNTVLNTTLISTIYLDKNHSFYNTVLNKYWSSLMVIKHQYIKDTEPQNVYHLKYFGCDDSERRSDFLYLESFKTGDILIYKNNDDITYKAINNILYKNYITYEEGEYAYIYIEGKGFLGINQGNNNNSSRNEFNSDYYKVHNLLLYADSVNTTKELLELANMLTLLGKDYYVILRPSLSFNLQNNNTNSAALIIVLLLLVILILVCGFFILWKYFVIKKEGKEFNLQNFKEKLIINK